MPIGLSGEALKTWFKQAMSYEEYLAVSPDKAVPWRENDKRCELADSQQSLLDSFSREMKVLCVSGVWCGDCSSQGPMLQGIASGSPAIELKWLDRDVAKELSEHLSINQGNRVPTVLFMSEDFEPVSVMGDRTLTRYRAKAAKSLGASCDLPTAVIPEDEFQSTMQDWLDEFERVQLLLRLSPRLRQKHGD
ncbi:MAG: thioredoxin family protein [Planctomycetota bacterium]|nr:thioredoxin family protein [Planctomycetota bacterium]